MKRLKLFFLNLPLTGKMLTVYVAVLIPTLALASSLYLANLNTMRQVYLQGQRYEIAAAGHNLTVQTNQIMAAANLIQESAALLELLDNNDINMSRFMFYYLRDVQPLLRIANHNPHIRNIRIYSFGDMIINMNFGLASLHAGGIDEGFANAVPGVSGFWTVDWRNGQPLLRYYRAIYATSWPFRRGLLELEIDFPALASTLQEIDAKSLFFITRGGDVIRYEDGIFHLYDSDIEYDAHLPTAFEFSFQNRFPDILVFMNPLEVTVAGGRFIVLIFVTMILVFTALYILLSKSIINRLQAFTSHLRRSTVESLEPFTSEYNDEIGIVIRSYDDLVVRTNTLIHENLIAQLRKQEAEYYALQSQIKPHFLYNILENIRMSAEANADHETADMLTTLGGYMRYSLNMSSLPIALEQELASARNYLQIHKIRMKDKINYSIEISTEIDDIFVPRFLLQPLLENAIKHGYRLDHPLQIHVTVIDGATHNRPDHVVLTVENDGNGIAREKLQQLQGMLRLKETDESNHIGLLNVNRRITTFYRTEEECIILESEEEQGVRLTILLKRGNHFYEDTNR